MIVAGFGFSTRATADSVKDAFVRATKDGDVGALAAPADKIAHLTGLATAIGASLVPVDASDLTAQTTTTKSDRSIKERHTGSVAEAAALAAAGPGAVLLQPRVVSADRLATCALAQGKPL